MLIKYLCLISKQVGDSFRRYIGRKHIRVRGVQLSLGVGHEDLNWKM